MKRISSGKSNSNDPSGSEGSDQLRKVTKLKMTITKHGENTFGYEYTARNGKTKKRTDRTRAWLKD